MAVLVQPSFREVQRPAEYVKKLAEKYPDAIIASAGMGLPVYTMERAALAAGLRVAAFRPEPFPPVVAAPRWPSEEDEEANPPAETRYRIMLNELVASDHVDLWRVDRREVAQALGHLPAMEETLLQAWISGSHRVVFTDGGWPPFDVSDAQVLGP